ncbi:MAG: hypothetical protein ACKPKO_02340, partial [Candidatus Fonsibacter sp.]
MSESESTPKAIETIAETTDIKPSEEQQTLPQAEPDVVGKPKRKPNEPNVPKKSKVIVVAVNPTEYFDDQAPSPPPATPEVVEQQPPQPKAKAKSKANAK